jgi:hypothetical protein
LGEADVLGFDAAEGLSREPLKARFETPRLIRDALLQ